MLTSEILYTISAYLCSSSCQYCYRIKQKYCIFYLKRSVIHVLKKYWEGVCGRGSAPYLMAELTTLPGPPTRLGRGTAATQCPPLDAFRVTISAPSAPRFNEPPPFFSACDPGLQCLQWGEISGGTQPLLWFLPFPVGTWDCPWQWQWKNDITRWMNQHYMAGGCYHHAR